MMNAIDLSTVQETLGAARTMRDVIRHWAGVSPESPAIAALNHHDMSYRDLAVLIDRIAGQLAARGFGADTRIALVHRGGPSMMTALLGISACSVLVSLNDSFSEDEFRWHITTRKIDAIIIEASFASPIRDVAASMGLPVIDAMTEGKDNCAGHITLDLPMGDETVTPDFTEAEDIAFIFATSGTTSNPKIVPLRHRHLLSRVESTSALYELTAHDKCLNLNRLFLCGGVSNAFTALYAGGCVAFLKAKAQVDLSVFAHALTALMPSWFVASFNFNVGVYQRLCRDPDYRPDHNLRFIRATSGRIDQEVTKGLENYFRVPVIEAYSSTETGRISGNPLPPGVRKPGTVGRVISNSEVSIIDDDGNPIPAGERGEVLARGDNVFDGYENNPAANEAAFFNGWYRTGDEGSFDADGYLTLTGRIKEMINRGGEKISPGEIDEMLNTHPEVVDAATCAVPHPTLGEVPAAAIVRTPESTVTEEDLFDFLGTQLTPVKVPRTLIFVDSIPRGPSGKIQRLQISALIRNHESGQGIKERGAGTFPTQTENRLLGMWRDVLPAGDIQRDDDFFMLGGDSLAATQLVLAVNDDFRIGMPLVEVFDVARTIAKMADRVDVLVKDGPAVGRIDLPMEVIDEEIAKIGDSASRDTDPEAAPAVFDVESGDLFVLEKDTGLRRMRPGFRMGAVKVNSHGFRSPEIPLAKVPGTIRLAFLSDSVAFGSWEMQEKETWPAQMVEQIKSSHPGLSCDYINASMPGNGIRHISLLYQQSIVAFRPDIVILAPGASPGLAAFARRNTGYSGIHYVSLKWLGNSRLLRKIEKNLVILWRQFRALSDRGKLTVQPSDLREISQDFETKLGALVTECQENGSLVVLLTRESRIRRGQSKLRQIWQAGSRLFYQPYMSISAILDVADEFNRLYREVASRSGAVIGDVVGILPASVEYYRDSSHLTAKASRLIGIKLAHAVTESGKFESLLDANDRSPR
jgi:acyl-CoA synthetase (AMP-forming)/AMP-acid ligase II/acyl carrier protein